MLAGAPAGHVHTGLFVFEKFSSLMGFKALEKDKVDKEEFITEEPSCLYSSPKSDSPGNARLRQGELSKPSSHLVNKNKT